MSSRSRLKPSKPLKTVIVVGEGETEGAFLCHLKDLYCERNSGILTKIEWTYGGSPQDIIQEAIKMTQSAAYDRSLLLLDTDVEWPPDAVARAQKIGIGLLGSKPCLEGFLLKIVNPNRQWETVSVKDCKKELHEKYLAIDHKVEPEKYNKSFGKDAIEVARLRFPDLDTLIRAMTIV